MKILHIIVCLNVGGAETMLKRLIEHDPASIPNTAIVSITSLGVIGKYLRDKGVNIYTLNMSSILYFPIALLRLAKIIYRYQPDIVQTWMYHADFMGGLAAYCLRKKVIWSIRNTHAAHGSGTSVATKYIMYLCAKLSFYIPKKIICVANSALISHKKYGYNSEIMLVIQNGYDVKKIHQAAYSIPRDFFRNELKITQDSIVIGTVGRYNDYKDYPTFIKAAEILSKLYINLRFLLIGRDVNYNNKNLVELISITECADYFILLDERDDIPNCLSVMDIFCLHSVSEGFPNVLGEAMCVGLPCVTTDVGDAALMVGDNGIVVPHSNPELLAIGLSKLIELTPVERNQIGKKLQQRIEKEYSVTKTQQAYKTLYQQVLNS